MAKKDDAAFGLLVLLGVVVFIISKVFEFVMENILFVGIIVGAVVIFFALIKYTQHQEDKRERERNIQNANLKGIKEKYEQTIAKIDRFQKDTIFRLEQINRELENHRTKELLQSKKSYDPVEAISKLKIILNNHENHKNEVWDLIYDNRIFTFQNPKHEFENKLKNIELLNEPQYFIQRSDLNFFWIERKGCGTLCCKT